MKTPFSIFPIERWTVNVGRSLALLLLWSVVCSPWSLLAGTPFSYQFYNGDGTPQTNVMTLQAWPEQTNSWTVYGTNIIFGKKTISLIPDTNGYGTNYAFPNSYRVYVSNLSTFFFISLPDTSNQIALGSCLISAPQVAGPLGFYAMITNWLGYAPATNAPLGIKAALGYTPATNSYAGITNALGLDPASNNAAGIKFALNYTPATNSLVGITNALGYNPQNATFAALTNTVGFVFATNGAGIAESQLPQIGWIGVTNLNGASVTNRATGQIVGWTNLAIGTAPTVAWPDGSQITATNGNTYLRSNATWINLK